MRTHLNLKVLSATLALFVAPAFAETRVEIGETVDISNLRVSESGISARFAYNMDPARSWVEIDLTEDDSLNTDYAPEVHTTRVKVDGLSFDAVSKEIIYQSDTGARVVCAQVVKKGFPFKFNSIRMTKNCKFDISTRTERVVNDDGFFRRFVIRRLVDIDLVTK
jgi:hypothetical protein